METTGKRGEDKKHARRMPQRKYAYFRDDQIVLLATHKEAGIPEERLVDHANKLNLHLKRLNEDAVVPSKPRVDSFGTLPNAQAKDGTPLNLSMVIYSVENAPADPIYLTNLITNYNQQQKEQKNSEPREREQQDSDGLQVIGASPNWLTSAASQSGGTGGPGGRPSPYNGSRQGAPYSFGDFIASLRSKDLYGDGTGVDVAVLDTAPSAHDLVAAPKEWPDHPLIKSLLGPQGRLKLYPAPYDEVLRLGNTSLNDHDYIMTDHGLFVAGIVHSIVPQANIHLIEVLNQYGVGDFVSFVRGLGVVLNQLYSPQRKLVINCSWMLELPHDELHCRHKDEEDPDAAFEHGISTFSQQDQTTATMLGFLFDEFYNVGRQAIAAAGNDGREEDPRRIRARYPAALENVRGIGALPKTLRTAISGAYERSTYSNLADDPPNNGIATLGGEDGEGKGVLGIYIGEFPLELNPSPGRKLLNWLIRRLGGTVTGPRNSSKWAWWSGTSFATPIVTGAVAAVFSKLDQTATTQDAIQKLYAMGIIKDKTQTGLLADSTVADEDVMPVFQN